MQCNIALNMPTKSILLIGMPGLVFLMSQGMEFCAQRYVFSAPNAVA